MSYARYVNTEWSTKLTTTDVRSAFANLTVSEFVCKSHGDSLSVNLILRVSVSENLMVRVSLSANLIVRVRVSAKRVCLSATLR